MINGTSVSLVLFFIGIYGLIARKNMLKTVMAFTLLQAAIILFFLQSNHQPNSVPPIGNNMPMADPFPQALMITAIVIGVAVTAVSLTMFITLYHRYGTTNWNKIISKRRNEG